MVAADYEVSTVSLDLDAGLLTGSFVFTSLNSSNSTKNLVAHIVAIEADVLKSSYSASPGNNIETHYEYVMRKMIPDANGTILVNKTLNGMDTISFSLPLTNIKDMSQVRVVAFVQNNTNKEIGQAQLFIPQFGSVGINENVIEEVGATLFPNPSNGNFNLSFSDDEIVKEVSVYNQFGELVYSQKQNTLNKLVIVSANLSTGLYNVKISSGSKVAIKKITIIN